MCIRDSLQIGGCIWGDNALAGRGSRFDVAFRREMKRVVPDLDKNFEPVDLTYDIFTKSWYSISKVPQGMNYYAEPLEHLDIDGKLAILYTPNDYSDKMCIRDRLYPGSSYENVAKAGKAELSLDANKIDEALAIVQPIVDQANKDMAPSPSDGATYAKAFLVYGRVLEAQKKPRQALEAYLTVKTMFYQNPALVGQADQRAKTLCDQNPGLGVD